MIATAFQSGQQRETLSQKIKKKKEIAILKLRHKSFIKLKENYISYTRKSGTIEFTEANKN